MHGNKAQNGMITQQEHMGVETVYKETACKMGVGGEALGSVMIFIL